VVLKVERDSKDFLVLQAAGSNLIRNRNLNSIHYVVENRNLNSIHYVVENNCFVVVVHV